MFIMHLSFSLCSLMGLKIFSASFSVSKPGSMMAASLVFSPVMR